MATVSRYDRLLEWMAGNYISFEDLGDKLGISASGARRLCNSETIPVDRHNQLMGLGFPADLVPEGRDRRRGRPKREPYFPGLAEQSSLSAS